MTSDRQPGDIVLDVAWDGVRDGDGMVVDVMGGDVWRAVRDVVQGNVRDTVWDGMFVGAVWNAVGDVVERAGQRSV